MTGATMFSGIQAPEAAMPHVDWKWCAEIEPFPCSVIKAHCDTPNLGDVMAADFIERALAYGRLDLLVGGSPCQAFSVAGLRRSLTDSRGNLTLRLVEVVHALRDQLDFFGKTSQEFFQRATTLSAASWRGLSALMKPSHQQQGGQVRVWLLDPSEQRPGASWMPNISAWPNDAHVCSLSSVLETGAIPQKYYLSSRACAGILRRAEKRGKVLPEPLALALRAVAGLEQTSISGGGLIPNLCPTLRSGGNQTGGDRPPGTDVDTCDSLIAMALNAKGRSGRIDGESETFVACPLASNPYGDHESRESLLITHSLRADGFDASEDGTGRGTPIIAACLDASYSRLQGAIGQDAKHGHIHLIAETLRSHPRPGSNSVGSVVVHATQDPCVSDVAFAMGRNSGQENAVFAEVNEDLELGSHHCDCGHQFIGLMSTPCPACGEFRPGYVTYPPIYAFGCKDHGADAGEIAPTLRSMGHDGSHANGGGQIAVAFDTTQITSKVNRSQPKEGDPCHPLASGAHPPAIAFRASGQEGFTPDSITPPLTSTDGGGTVPSVAFQEAQTGVREYDTAGTLRADGPGHDPVGTQVRSGMAVRRLTPKECERMQGFPDCYYGSPASRQGSSRWTTVQGTGQQHGGPGSGLDREENCWVKGISLWILLDGNAQPSVRLGGSPLSRLASPYSSRKEHFKVSQSQSTTSEDKKSPLFIGLFPAGFGYADTRKEEDGDYKKVAFMSYSTLNLDVYAPKSDLLPEIREHAAKIQSRRGESYPIAGNMSVTLGGKS